MNNEVDQVVEIGHVVVAVDQAGIGRRCGVDPRPRGLGLVERDGQHREAVAIQLLVQ